MNRILQKRFLFTNPFHNSHADANYIAIKAFWVNQSEPKVNSLY